MILIFFVILISACLSSYDPYTREYAGQEIHFRADLSEAEKIPVYPDEETLRDVLLSRDVIRVFVAYFPNETENVYYLADSFELAYKLTIIYKHKFNHVNRIESLPINSTDELVPTYVEPIILLLGPTQANQTAVTVENNLIIVEGESLEETDRIYTDLDLATDKLLLVLME